MKKEKQLIKIPSGYTEEEVVKIIDHVADILAYKFVFGSHSVEDIKQQARLIAWSGLAGFKPPNKLDGFLYIHVKNRLCSFKRDNYERLDKPCLTCPFYNTDTENQCDKFEDKGHCELYTKWIKRSNSKKNIARPVSFGDNADSYEVSEYADVTDNLIKKEVFELLDKHIPNSMRVDYIKLKSGIKLPKHRRYKLSQAILDILKANNYLDKDGQDV